MIGDRTELIRKRVVNPSLDDRLKKEDELRSRFLASNFFTQNRSPNDPRLTLIDRFLHFNQHVSKTDEYLDMNEADIRELKKLNENIKMDELAFQNLSRLFWFLESFAQFKKSDSPYFLNRIIKYESGGYLLSSLEGITGYDSITYECPGIESLAIWGIGYQTIMGAAIDAQSVVRLYGKRGIRFNNNLRDLALEAQEINQLIENRKNFYGELNIQVEEIDISTKFDKVPENFAIARAMLELGYKTTRNLDDGFVKFMSKRKQKNTNDDLEEIVNCCGNENSLSSINDQDLKKHLYNYGEKILKSEEIFGLADIIFRAEEYKDREFWFTKCEKDNTEAGRIANIWKKLLPSPLTETIGTQFFDLARDAKKLSLPKRRTSLAYFMGEFFSLMGSLLRDKSRAQLVFGNYTERYWHDCVNNVMSKPSTLEDALWLFEDIIPEIRENHANFDTKEFAPMISALYNHYTFKGAIKKGSYGVTQASLKSAIFIPYSLKAVPGNISKIPLFSDTYRELLSKFQDMENYNPNQITKMVVGAIYALINLGTGDEEAIEKFTKNSELLQKASLCLPQPYREFVTHFDPRDISHAIDLRIGTGSELSASVLPKIDFDKMINKLGELKTGINKVKEAARVHAVDKIAELIDIEKAKSNLQGIYQGRYEKIKTMLRNQIRKSEINVDENPNILAHVYFSLFTVSEKKRKKGYEEMSVYLNELGPEDFYDLEFGKLLDFIQGCQSTVQRKVKTFKNLSSVINTSNDNSVQKISQGTFLAEYLDSACELITELGHKMRLLRDLKVDEKYPKILDLENLVKIFDSYANDVTNQILAGVNEDGFISYFGKRFKTRQPLIERVIEYTDAKNDAELKHAVSSIVRHFRPDKNIKEYKREIISCLKGDVNSLVQLFTEKPIDESEIIITSKNKLHKLIYERLKIEDNKSRPSIGYYAKEIGTYLTGDVAPLVELFDDNNKTEKEESGTIEISSRNSLHKLIHTQLDSNDKKEKLAYESKIGDMGVKIIPELLIDILELKKTDKERLLLEFKENPRQTIFKLFNKFQQTKSIYISDEIFLLEKINAQLGNMEKDYVDRKNKYQTNSMFPHQCQLALAERNFIRTLTDYFQLVKQYVAKKGKWVNYKADPAFATKPERSSVYYINPESAAKFFGVIRSGLSERVSLGKNYFNNHKSLVNKLLKKAA